MQTAGRIEEHVYEHTPETQPSTWPIGRSPALPPDQTALMRLPPDQVDQGGLHFGFDRHTLRCGALPDQREHCGASAVPTSPPETRQRSKRQTGAAESTTGYQVIICAAASSPAPCSFPPPGHWQPNAHPAPAFAPAQLQVTQGPPLTCPRLTRPKLCWARLTRRRGDGSRRRFNPQHAPPDLDPSNFTRKALSWNVRAHKVVVFTSTG